jgi:hypothetical protein
MRQFLQHHAGNILGVLSGFDRWRLRGGLRMFGSENGVVGWLQNAGIALKDFLTWAKDKTNQLRRNRRGGHYARASRISVAEHSYPRRLTHGTWRPCRRS